MATGLARGEYVRMLAAVYTSMFLIRVAFGITIVTFASYLTAGDFVYSLVVTAAPLVELLTVAFAGILIDRYGRKGVLLTGLGLGAISLYGLALTKNVLLLGFVQAIHGVAAALILVTTLAIIAAAAPAAHRGREMGFFNLANIFGWIFGFALGGVLLDLFVGRLEYTFVLAGGLATAGLLFANRMIPRGLDVLNPGGGASTAAAEHRPSVKELGKAIGQPRLMLLVVPWLIVFMLVGPFITFFPRISGGLQISGTRTAVGVLAFGVLLLVSQLVWGRLSDKMGRERIMLVGAVGFALLMGVIVLAFFETGPLLETTALDTFEVGADTTAVTAAAASPYALGIMAAAPAASDPGHPVPVVDDVAPTRGPPGTQVEIRGKGLSNVTHVLFGGVRAEFVVNENGTRLSATVPDDAATGSLVLESPTPPQRVFQNVMAHWFLLTLFLFTALAFAPAGLAAIADEAKGGAEGTTMAAYSLTLSLGFILGPPVVGAISETFGGPGMVAYFAILAATLLGLVVTRFVTASPAARSR